jgi:hypothetical protein
MLTLLFTAGAFAHETHCHLKNADGTLTDATEYTTRKSCQKAGGVWKHHHAHCHRSGDKHADLTAKTEAECLAQGGQWSDHGHTPAKRTAR